MKIGVFGGSFNPPHRAHLSIASKLIEKQYVDQVIFVPAGDLYKKPDLISIDDRVLMLKMSLPDHFHYAVSDLEKKTGFLTTYDTLNHFQKKYPNDQIFFIMGSDNLKELSHWKKVNQILDNFFILVILRNQDTKETLKSYLKEHIIITKIKEEPISSSWIRKTIKQYPKKEISFLSPLVREYIAKNHLYM